MSIGQTTLNFMRFPSTTPHPWPRNVWASTRPISTPWTRRSGDKSPSAIHSCSNISQISRWVDNRDIASMGEGGKLSKITVDSQKNLRYLIRDMHTSMHTCRHTYIHARKHTNKCMLNDICPIMIPVEIFTSYSQITSSIYSKLYIFPQMQCLLFNQHFVLSGIWECGLLIGYWFRTLWEL